jgi:hypothetical protein
MRNLNLVGLSLCRGLFALRASHSSARQKWAVFTLFNMIFGLVLSVSWWPARAAHATTIDLCALVNDFEDPNCGIPFPWIPTRPNSKYRLNSPQCNPPTSTACPLVAPPTGSVGNFVGVLNPGDNDTSGKLAHRAIAGPWPAGTCFTVTLNAKRDRCVVPVPPSSRPTQGIAIVQIRGWAAGAVKPDEPMVSPATDDWSRRELFKCDPQAVFMPGDPDPGDVTRTFSCCPNTGGKDIAYVTWTISGRDPRLNSYVAFACP